MHRYPRDFRGHGPNAPDARWPGAAKIAVSIVLNYEEGGENNILHGDAQSEAFLSDIAGAAPWPGQRHWNMESIYDYGARAGFWRLHRLFVEKSIPVTIYGVTSALARNPEQVAAMKAAGWEIASHGLKWVDHRDMPEAEEAAQIAESFRLHEEVVGEPPQGWYTGRCSMNTVRLTAETRKLAWISDIYDDDLPYWREYGDHDQLVIPYTLEANDMRFATAPGYITGEQFFQYLKDSFDSLYAEGEAGAAKMFSIGLHCRLIGRPGKIAGLKRFLDYAKSHTGVWFPRRIDIARHWQKTHPHKRFERPSQIPRDRFVELFGSIFEHSPWIADRAFDLELGPAHDSATGLHNALTRMFRSASPEERLKVLKAHPDLAGKLAAAKRLTPESTAEQASAALDSLTDEERSRFQRLNDAYVAKHGFPFIIAVRDNSKASILQAFEVRIANDTPTEFATACAQVERIAELRLKDQLPMTDKQSGYYAPPGGLPPQTALMTQRAVFTTAYAFIPRGCFSDIVTSSLPGWTRTKLWLIARPMSGFAETFSQYVMEVQPGGGSDAPDPDTGAEHWLFFTGGLATLTIDGTGYEMEEGSYAYLPPETRWTLLAEGQTPARFHWLRKIYEPASGTHAPQAFVINERDVPVRWMPDTAERWGTTRFVEPDDIAHDAHVNIVTFQPGGVIPFEETHVMEHGLYVLEGKAVYKLNQDWVEVEAGDFMWLRAYCPQACYAAGPGLFRYLLYKDVNRHAKLRGPGAFGAPK